MSKWTFGVFVTALAWPVTADEMRFPRIVGASVPGAPQLEQPFLVMAGDGPVVTEKHGLAAPALWDWDGDGKRDLLVGEFETNSGEDFPMGADGSTMRVYRNVGTDANPKFGPSFQWAKDTAGTIMEVPQWCCIGFTPHFYDLNADGRLDIITGQYHPGEVTWYRGAERGFLPGVKLPQEGDPEADANPAWGDYKGEPGDIGTFHYWVYSSASMGDFDDDGDYDLVFGGSGGLRISENIGGRNSPSFAQRHLLLDVNGEPLRILNKPSTQPPPEDGGYIPPPDGDGKSNPTVADWNNDGVLDLLVTGSYRHPASQAVTFFRGVKTSAGHRFHPGVDLLKAEDGAKALPGSGPRVYVDDWNKDGVQDLIIGASVATVNGGEFSDELSWEWEDVNEVESAGKDPGLYPPRPKPTAESMKDMLARVAESQSQEEADELLAFNVEYWEKSIGRLYKEGKAHWLTMRHQGRVYVMLGRQPKQDQAMAAPPAPAPTAAEAPATAPVRVRLETAAQGDRTALRVRFAVRDGWYIYAPTGRNTPQGMIETKVRFQLPPAVAPVGGLLLPPHHYKGPYDIYEGGFTWEQHVAAAADARDDAAHAGDVVARVTYQTCKDDLCLPPRTETLHAALPPALPRGAESAAL